MDSITKNLPASIETDRLVLTTPTLAHVPEMAVLANSEAIYSVLSRLPHPYAQSDGKFFVESIARGDSEFAWSILLQDKFIGVVGLHLFADKPAELGYWLGEPHWGMGYGSEAASAVVAAARNAGFVTLSACALTTNTASLNLLRRIGFSHTHQGPGPQGTNAGAPTTFMRLDFANGETT